MEEAGSSLSRRVVIDFAPQRTHQEILALAFEWLTTNQETRRSVGGDSVQTQSQQGTSQVPSYQEMRR